MIANLVLPSDLHNGSSNPPSMMLIFQSSSALARWKGMKTRWSQLPGLGLGLSLPPVAETRVCGYGKVLQPFLWKSLQLIAVYYANMKCMGWGTLIPDSCSGLVSQARPNFANQGKGLVNCIYKLCSAGMQLAGFPPDVVYQERMMLVFIVSLP